MYYIRDGLSKRFGGRASAFFGSVFAVLCIANSLVTGNIVQSSAASSALSPKHRIVTGAILAVLVLFSIIFGTRRIERITAYLIPPLAGVYIVITAYVIFSNLSLAGEVFCDIFSSAFSYRAVLGGAAGFCMRDAVRYGIMRGIFSNEIYIIGLGHNLSKREVFWPYFYGYGGIQNDNRYDFISPSGFAAPLPCSPRQTA